MHLHSSYFAHACLYSSGCECVEHIHWDALLPLPTYLCRHFLIALRTPGHRRRECTLHPGMYRVPHCMHPLFHLETDTNKVIDLRMFHLGTANENAPSHKCIGPNQSWAPQWECTLLTTSVTMIPERFYWDEFPPGFWLTQYRLCALTLSYN